MLITSSHPTIKTHLTASLKSFFTLSQLFKHLQKLTFTLRTSYMNFLINRIERRVGLDLNGDGYIGGEGFLSKLERKTHIDFNGDNIIGRPPDVYYGDYPGMYGGYPPMYGGYPTTYGGYRPTYGGYGYSRGRFY